MGFENMYYLDLDQSVECIGVFNMSVHNEKVCKPWIGCYRDVDTYALLPFIDKQFGSYIIT